jgi:hypothetical protein
MAEWKRVVLKGDSIANLGLVGAAEGDLLVAGSGAFTFAALTTGTVGQVLTSGGAAAALSWSSAGSGDFKADGSVPMTAPLRLLPNAGEGGMGTVNGSIFFDDTDDSIKVYVA